MTDLPVTEAPLASANLPHAPNRAALKTTHSVPVSPASHAINELSVSVKKLAAEIHQPGLNDLWKSMVFIDTDNMSADERRALCAALRKNIPSWSRPQSDDQLIQMDRFSGVGLIPNSTIVSYSGSQLRRFAGDFAPIFAHEFGHAAIEGGFFIVEPGLSIELGADEISARLTSPQRMVNILKAYTVVDPSANMIPYVDEEQQRRQEKYTSSSSQDKLRNDRARHGTPYYRALYIQDKFRDHHVDLTDFPKSTSEVTVSGKDNSWIADHISNPLHRILQQILP